MDNKQIFIDTLKARTKKFAVDIIKFCENLESHKAITVITYQLIKSSTSIGANYRAACRGRSRGEFFSKIYIVVEEADESEYWLEIISNSEINCHQSELLRLKNEASEITKIMAKAKSTSYQ